MSGTVTNEAPGNDRLHRWIGPALLISVIVNLFLAGIVGATVFVRHGPADIAVPPPFLRMMHRGAANLPANDRAAVRDIMIQEFPALRPYIAKIDIAREGLAVAIAADPYDPRSVGAAFAKVDEAQADMIKATRAAMIEGFGKMSQAQRDRFANVINKQVQRRRMSISSDHPPAPPQQ